MNLYKASLVGKDVKIFSNDPPNKLQINLMADSFSDAYTKLYVIMAEDVSTYRDMKIFSLKESLTDVK